MKNEKTTKKNGATGSAENKDWNSSKTPGNKAGTTSDRSPNASTRDSATQADVETGRTGFNNKSDQNQRSQVNSGKYDQTINDDGDRVIPSREHLDDDEDYDR